MHRLSLTVADLLLPSLMQLYLEKPNTLIQDALLPLAKLHLLQLPDKHQLGKQLAVPGASHNQVSPLNA